MIFGKNPLLYFVPFSKLIRIILALVVDYIVNYVPHDGLVFEYDAQKLIKGSKEYQDFLASEEKKDK